MRKNPARTLIVLGSGGHTAEMIEIVKSLDKRKYCPRLYCLAKTDITSKRKAEEIEINSKSKDFGFFEVYRSREVKQSYVTSIITTIIAIFSSIPILWKTQPELVLVNGPGTCVPICLIAFIFRLFYLIPKNCKIVFIESFCRVKTISLSGKILGYFTDLFVIHWTNLLNSQKKYKYFGKLI